MQATKRVIAVKIGSGEKREVVLYSYSNENFRFIYFPEHLRKDGLPNGNRRCDGFLGTSLNEWALYDEEREAQAQLIRYRVAELMREVHQAQEDLQALYCEPAARAAGEGA